MPEKAERQVGPIRTIMGPAALMRIAFDGHDLTPIVHALLDKFRIDPTDAGAVLDLATVLILREHVAEALDLQEQALEIARHFGLRSNAIGAAIRVLAIVTAGDFMANTPLEFLLQHPDFALEFLFVQPGEPMPAVVPDHDILIVAIAYSRRNAGILKEIAPALDRWPCPVVNRPAMVLQTSREGIVAALSGIAGMVAPAIRIMSRAELLEGVREMSAFRFPALIRPIDSHAGNDLHKLGGWSDVKAYLADTVVDEFYVADFCDYRSADGLFRKYRVALIGGRPFLAHLALRDTWMIHYLNAGMLESAAKRAAEAKAMSEFDNDFAERHRSAFAEMHARLGLDYLVIDCGEMPDGRLVVFEADTGMVVHDMDPGDIYPYKRPQMLKVFAAFQQMMRARLVRKR